MQEAISALSLDRLHIDTTSFVYTGQDKEAIIFLKLCAVIPKITGRICRK
ncbi:hypothetical protein GCM10011409_32800 [Lentibacillus populi]|uniref:Uncharacterized protein n=1 Tax=Lentibacillus populi TaxID=1827502 RepID=A0A9W5TZU7_9BACI|nr:hypothetical protein GCM10011409_32800 [Lentibacillus populi]